MNYFVNKPFYYGKSLITKGRVLAIDDKDIDVKIKECLLNRFLIAIPKDQLARLEKNAGGISKLGVIPAVPEKKKADVKKETPAGEAKEPETKEKKKSIAEKIKDKITGKK